MNNLCNTIAVNAIKDYENVCQRLYEAIRLIAIEKMDVKFNMYSRLPKANNGYIVNGIHVNDNGNVILDFDEDYYLKNGWGEVVCTQSTLSLNEQYILLNNLLNC